jgi:hypothetical protein
VISLAYLQEDGLLLSIGLLVAVIALTVEFVAIWATAIGAEWFIHLW